MQLSAESAALLFLVATPLQLTAYYEIGAATAPTKFSFGPTYSTLETGLISHFQGILFNMTQLSAY